MYSFILYIHGIGLSPGVTALQLLLYIPWNEHEKVLQKPFNPIGHVQMSVHMQYTAPQTCLRHHTPHALHMRALPVLLICGGEVVTPRDPGVKKKTLLKKAGRCMWQQHMLPETGAQ